MVGPWVDQPIERLVHGAFLAAQADHLSKARGRAVGEHYTGAVQERCRVGFTPAVGGGGDALEGSKAGVGCRAQPPDDGSKRSR